MVIDIEVFHRNLSLTQLYCKDQLSNTYKNYASILRSYNPQVEGRPLFEFKLITFQWDSRETSCYFNSEWTTSPLGAWYRDFLHDLLEKQLMHKSQLLGDSIQIEELKGSVIVVEMENTTVDGASSAESQGLFDDYDYPPLDSWFYLTESERGIILFAWIPDAFSFLTKGAIAVNCPDCIHWFKEYSPEEYNRIFDQRNDSRSTIGA